MVQKNEVLTQEDNCIPLICRKRTAAQEDCLAITEREIPMNAIEQTCMFEVGEETRVGRTSPMLVDTLVKVTKWLNHLGSGKIDGSRLQSRHNIHHNFKINGIGR
ncbi:MAG: hypothetical protein OEU97_06235 [Dehalococcoidia bacterium]|nr:hypothetical protein [Dehalococcoidia bacterium]MDH4367746.1 hypothetical protein [Dehalococcoidia bacterium]